MHLKVMRSPTGRRLIQRDLEQRLPLMGYCIACGKRFFNQPPEGPPLTYCGCLGAGVGLRKAPRRFCPGCGNGKRCRCPGRTSSGGPGSPGIHRKRKIADSRKRTRRAVEGPENRRQWFPMAEDEKRS